MIKDVGTLIRELETRSTLIAQMDLASGKANDPITGGLLNIANRPADLDRVARAVEVLVNKAGLTSTNVKVAVSLLLDAKQFYGSYCEIGTYDWLDRHDVRFWAQKELTGGQVLNPNGCTIDGQFKRFEAYFDIKAFGLQYYLADQFRILLQSKMTDLDVTIEGPMDVSVKDIELLAFRQIPALSGKLVTGGNERITKLGWTIRAAPPGKFRLAETTFNPYRFAKENRYYPLKTARQFSRCAPFILIFAYAAQFNHALFTNFAKTTDIALRSLARRVFLQLSNDVSPANGFDDKVDSAVSVAEAAKLISGLLFINLDDDGALLFLNPRATYLVKRHQIDHLFDFHPLTNILVDDFVYDDY